MSKLDHFSVQEKSFRFTKRSSFEQNEYIPSNIDEIDIERTFTFCYSNKIDRLVNKNRNVFTKKRPYLKLKFIFRTYEENGLLVYHTFSSEGFVKVSMLEIFFLHHWLGE